MKKALIPATLILISGVALTTGVASGQEVAPTAAPDFATLDANQDGSLSKDEAAAVEGLDFDAADQDKDGVLSQEEYEAAVGGAPEMEGEAPAPQ